MSNNRTVKKPGAPGSKSGSGKQPHKGYVAPTPTKSRAFNPVVLVVVGLVVVAVIALIAVAITSDSGDTVRTPEGVEQTRTVTVDGTALPPFESPQGDPAVGQAAPTLEGQTFDGTPLTIDPGSGENYTLLVFAAHWCPHCQKEIPVIADWMNSGAQPDNLDVYAVSTGIRSDYMTSQLNWPPSVWFDEVKWPAGTVLADSGPDQAAAGGQQQVASQAYGLTGYPMVVMIDPDGNVIERHSGEFDIPSNPEPFPDCVARTMAGTSTPSSPTGY
jgi:thiol-disulfide isomerase/thioredoxin